MKSRPKNGNGAEDKRGLPKEPPNDGFPHDNDVSTPPKNTDQSDHRDKKR